MSKSYKCVVVGDACVGKTCMLGKKDYRNLRTKSYSSVDVYEKDAIVLLVGTKHDLCREDGSRSAAVSRAKIDELCGSHGSLKYVECSR
uniref:Rho-related BTB domain-containing protein 2 n=1 Tax=Macrostomum lignano TaxID=282301 RepID=A0A1I8F910_9PLAT